MKRQRKKVIKVEWDGDNLYTESGICLGYCRDVGVTSTWPWRAGLYSVCPEENYQEEIWELSADKARARVEKALGVTPPNA